MRSCLSIISAAAIVLLSVSPPGLAQESVFSEESLMGNDVVVDRLSLSEEADTIVRRLPGPDWDSDGIKDLLAKETGGPDIDGDTWKKRKNPRIAMICALVFPGLGQVYNEKAFKAVIAMGAETYYIMNLLHNYRKANDYLKLRDSFDKYVVCGPLDSLTCLNPDWRYNNAWYEEYKERTVDWIWWTSAAILVIMIDAYVDAHLHDMRFRLETARRGGGTGIAVVVDF